MKLIKDLGNILPTSGCQKRKYKYGIYECPICKIYFKTRSKEVISGQSTKCRSCATSIMLTTHGDTKKRLYSIWRNMRRRCSGKYKCYQRYTDLNIKVCDDWQNSYEAFRAWAESTGYSELLSLDRIKGDMGYYPENCRWATSLQQSHNTFGLASTNTTGYKGVGRNKNRKKFGAQIRVNGKRVWLGAFDEAIDAAKAYNNYVIKNQLNHTLNII